MNVLLGVASAVNLIKSINRSKRESWLLSLPSPLVLGLELLVVVLRNSFPFVRYMYIVPFT